MKEGDDEGGGEKWDEEGYDGGYLYKGKVYFIILMSLEMSEFRGEIS